MKRRSVEDLEAENRRLRLKIQKLEKLHSEDELNDPKRVTYRYVPSKTGKPQKPKDVDSDVRFYSIQQQK